MDIIHSSDTVFSLDGQLSAMLTTNRRHLHQEINCTSKGCFTASQSTEEIRSSQDIAAWNISIDESDYYPDATSSNGDGFDDVATSGTIPIVLSGVVLLSLWTAMLSICAYVKCKDLRTVTRQLLVAASIVDSGTSVCHLLSIWFSSDADSTFSAHHGSNNKTPWFLIAMNTSQQSSMLLNAAFVARTYVTVVYGVRSLNHFTTLALACSIGIPCMVTLGSLGYGQRNDLAEVQLQVSEPLRLTATAVAFFLCFKLSRHISKEVKVMLFLRFTDSYTSFRTVA